MDMNYRISCRDHNISKIVIGGTLDFETFIIIVDCWAEPVVNLLLVKTKKSSSDSALIINLKSNPLSVWN